MLQVNVIRQNPEFVKERLAIKHFKQLELVDEVLKLDDKRKQIQAEQDNLLAKINALSKEIGQLMAKGNKDEAEAKKKEVAELKSKQGQDNLSETEKKIESLLYQIPNLPSEKVPKGKTPEDNVVVREGGMKPKLPADAVPHWDLVNKYNLIDFELGNKITGSGFPFYINKGASCSVH